MSKPKPDRDQPGGPWELKGQTEPMSHLALVRTGKIEEAPGVGSPMDPTAAVPPQTSTVVVDRGPGMADRNARLRRMVDDYVDFVARVLRNAGTPQADIDDEVQRTFITAARRLDDVRPGSEKAFLFRIALNLAAHARRTIARRREVRADEAPERVDTVGTPERLTDQKRMRQLLDRILDEMEEPLRAVFVLHEFEEMSTSEVAAVLGIPRGTAASRLRRARVEFRTRVRAYEGTVEGYQRKS
jgi:RNA polymerase sigma-70 factor (ECF subfamily)